MEFGEVLKRAWTITWRFKVLWLFGILASCGTGGGGGFNSGYSTSGNELPPRAPNLPPGPAADLERLRRFLSNPAVVAGLLGLICFLVLLALCISTIGRIGLIRGVLAAEGGAERLAFGELGRESLGYFWRMLGLTLLLGLPFFVVIAVLMAAGIVLLPASARGMNEGAAVGLMFLLLCPLSCVILLLALLLGLIAPQAENAIVIENRGLLSGLQRGWEVLSGNLGPILIIWLIQLVIAFAAGLLIAAPVLIAVVPLFVSAMTAQNGAFSYLPLVLAGLCMLAYTPISLLANGIVSVYIQSVWSLTYLRLTRPAPAGAVMAVTNA